MNALGHVSGLRVAARTSAFAVKGVAKDLREVGELLDVAAVVEGSVRRANERVRITVKLVDAENGFEIWGEQYDREIADIFEIQGDIAARVVDAMAVEAGLGASADPSARHPGSIQAYDYLLLGKHYQHARTEESLRRSIGLFERALELEPDYAAALQEQARSQLLLAFYGRMPLDEALRLADVVLKTAMTHKSDPQVLATQGLALYLRGDFAAAQSTLEHSLQLAPGLGEASMWLGLTLQARGLLDAARAHFMRAPATGSRADGRMVAVRTGRALAEGAGGPGQIPDR